MTCTLYFQVEEEGQVEEPDEQQDEEEESEEPQQDGGNEDPWDALLAVIPQQWHQAFNILRVCVCTVCIEGMCLYCLYVLRVRM